MAAGTTNAAAQSDETKGYITFAINTHDWLHVDESADIILRLIELYEKHGVRGDFYLTAPMTHYYTESRPDVIRRLRESDMTISFHIRPPHVLYPGFNGRIRELDGDQLAKTLRDYETHRLDMATGELLRDQPGGYQYVAETFGRKPVALGIPTGSPRERTAARQNYRELGARVLVEHHESGTKLDRPFEWVDGLLIRPSDFSITRWLLPGMQGRAAFWWNMLSTPRAADYNPTAYLKKRLVEWKGPRPPLITCLIHENNFFRARSTPFALIYYTDTRKTRPLEPPFDLAGPDASVVRPPEDCRAIWQAYEEIVAYAAANLKVVTSEDIIKMAESAQRLEDRSIAAPPEQHPVRRQNNIGQIDIERARQLLQKQRDGQTLTEQEQAYLKRVRQMRRPSGQKGTNPDQIVRTSPRREMAPKETIGLTPLIEMKEATYKGEDGGLYGGSRNEPPGSHRDKTRKALEDIKPLDGQGRPSKDGKIVLISNGMSNTTQEFAAFKKIADQDPDRTPSLVIVDGAIGGMEAHDWAEPENRFNKNRPDPWVTLDQRLRDADVTPLQVQVAWIKTTRRRPADIGEFPAHARELQGKLVTLVNRLKVTFPNLQIAYLSSRIYGGYGTTLLCPEPHSYENAFAMRWLIQDQIKGAPELNPDPAKGDVKAPVLLWGPYLWADGLTPRKSDDLVWKREDFGRDGTHPSEAGREKVAHMLLDFFKTNPLARTWFLQTHPEGRPVQQDDNGRIDIARICLALPSSYCHSPLRHNKR